MTIQIPAFGPLDLVVLGCTEETMPAVVDAAVLDLTASTAVEFVDFIEIRKDSGGQVRIRESADLPPTSPFSRVVLSSIGLVGEEDVAAVAEGLAPGSCAVALVIEHTWARELVAAVRHSNAYLLAAERVSAAVVNEIIDTATIEIADLDDD